MLIVDHPRLMTLHESSHYLSLQPYQTGPLGLLPDTEVEGMLLTPKTVLRSRGQVELYLTAERARTGRLGLMRCMLYDGPGVIDRLLRVIAEMSINVAYMRSGPVRNGHLHLVEVLLDWDQSPYRGASETRPSVVRSYREIGFRIPIMQHRYALLYEAILTALPTEVFLDDAYQVGRRLPSLQITPLANRHQNSSGARRKVIRRQGMPRTGMKGTSPFRPSFVEVLPEEHRVITEACAYADNELPLFIACAESDTRTLRIAIPHRERARRVVTAALIHADNPGALHTVMEVIEASGFNVITSVTRRLDSSTAELEVTLEPTIKAHLHEEAKLRQERTSDNGDDHWLDVAKSELAAAVEAVAADADFSAPDLWNPSSPERVAWLQTQIERFIAHEANDEIATRWEVHEIEISQPRYPAPAAGARPRSHTPRRSHHPDGYVDRPRDLEGRLRKQATVQIEDGLEKLEEFQQTRRVHDKRRWLHKLRVLDNFEPKIFFSYPQGARSVAKDLKAAIKEASSGLFQFLEYQERDFSSIQDEVARRITSADFFIGIWHHELLTDYVRGTEREDRKAGPFAVSPWLPYEFGLARQLQIPSIVIHSGWLPETLTSRINLALAEPSYDPDDPSKAASDVAEYVMKYWEPTVRAQRRPIDPDGSHTTATGAAESPTDANGDGADQEAPESAEMVDVSDAAVARVEIESLLQGPVREVVIRLGELDDKVLLDLTVAERAGKARKSLLEAIGREQRRRG